jgi:hypothetical protein
MAARRTRSKTALAAQAAELALAVPQVVAHRVWRMAAAGHNPSARDRKEFALMGNEKTTAFFESWAAMGWAMWRVQQQLWLSMFGLAMSPWSRQGAHRAAVDVLGSGLAPVRRRAVANAKRLAKVRF